MAFSLARIVLTAAVCSGAAGAVLVVRRYQSQGRAAPRAVIIVFALGLGLSVVAWRELSNLWRLNEDFAPAISIADVGSGLVPWILLLALRAVPPTTRPVWFRRVGLRSWLVTSTAVAFALFVCNVVLI
jgi:hypothetical protein